MKLKQLLQGVPYRHHFRLHRCYHVHVGPKWGIPRRRNEDLHVVLIRGGVGGYVLDAEEVQLRRGRLIFVSSGFPHSSWPQKNDPPQITSLRFGMYDNQTGAMVPLPGEPFAEALEVDAHRYESRFYRVWQLSLMTRDAQATALLSSLLHQILAEMVFDSEAPQHQIDSRIERVRRKLLRRPEQRMSLVEMAKIAGLSQKHFARRFKEITGYSPVDYAIRERINRARYMLSSTEMNVSEIAADLGYPDIYSFSRQFKKVTDRSPMQVRNS